jgi:competence protein ComGC
MRSGLTLVEAIVVIIIIVSLLIFTLTQYIKTLEINTSGTITMTQDGTWGGTRLKVLGGEK